MFKVTKNTKYYQQKISQLKLIFMKKIFTNIILKILICKNQPSMWQTHSHGKLKQIKLLMG